MPGQSVYVRPLDGMFLDWDRMQEIYPIAREFATPIHIAWTPLGAEVSAHIPEKDAERVMLLVEKMSEVLFGAPDKLNVSLDVGNAALLLLRHLSDLDQWVKEQVGGIPVEGYRIGDIVVEGALDRIRAHHGRVRPP